ENTAVEFYTGGARLVGVAGAAGKPDVDTMRAHMEIATVHGVIRELLIELYQDRGREIRILYGGSMKPGNAAEILAIENVNGGLIGGASLKADDFMAIYAAAVA
ncbi:MAG: triose-phosphate isomerase, partial [Alphaproteobacteria bacterium]|nr:triose-phosphate isomerase [Alphaproteobacteria bacterium]